jgi:hypothetical protein
MPRVEVAAVVAVAEMAAAAVVVGWLRGGLQHHRTFRHHSQAASLQ